MSVSDESNTVVTVACVHVVRVYTHMIAWRAYALHDMRVHIYIYACVNGYPTRRHTGISETPRRVFSREVAL